jgi:hypothetical protein
MLKKRAHFLETDESQVKCFGVNQKVIRYGGDLTGELARAPLPKDRRKQFEISSHVEAAKLQIRSWRILVPLPFLSFSCF